MERENKAYELNMPFFRERRREIFDSLIDVYNYPTTVIGNKENNNYLEFISGDDDFEINDEYVRLEKIENVSIIKKDGKKHINVIEVTYHGRNEYDVEIPESQYEEAVNIVVHMNKIIQKRDESLILCNNEYKEWIKSNGVFKIDMDIIDSEIYSLLKKYSPYYEYKDADIIYFSKLKKENDKIYWNFKNKFNVELPFENSNVLRLINLEKVKCADVGYYIYSKDDGDDEDKISLRFVFTYPIERG